MRRVICMLKGHSWAETHRSIRWRTEGQWWRAIRTVCLRCAKDSLTPWVEQDEWET
jgi:hypothetical protein